MKITWLALIILISNSVCFDSDEIIKVEGTAVEYFQNIGAWGWKVDVDEVINGEEELQGREISVYLTSADPSEYPPGFLDPYIEAGDKVEVYGQVDFCENAGDCDITLTGSADYYIRRINGNGSDT